MISPIKKYPRTRHIAGSAVQKGDEDLNTVPFAAIAKRHVVVEEKVDGANCGVSFDAEGSLRLQSRGHFLTGGPRERHFALLKQWANTHADALFDALGDRFVLYGEWLYAKHTIFYDALPHYLMEFDVLDLRDETFLDTPRRAELLARMPIVPVRVLFSGVLRDEEQLKAFVGNSAFKTAACNAALEAAALRAGVDPKESAMQSDASPLMEGLYIKVEEGGVVKERYKFVRPDFVTRILDSESHWLSRPIVQNKLAPDADIFAAKEGAS
jgi:hypothetical protein